jgi:hypothetical protein
MNTTTLSVPHSRNGKQSNIPIVINYLDGKKKPDTAIVLTHGASGDYSTGYLPLLGEGLRRSTAMYPLQYDILTVQWQLKV